MGPPQCARNRSSRSWSTALVDRTGSPIAAHAARYEASARSSASIESMVRMLFGRCFGDFGSVAGHNNPRAFSQLSQSFTACEASSSASNVPFWPASILNVV